MYTAYYESPIGTIKIIGSDLGIEALEFLESKQEKNGKTNLNENMILCLKELDEYFTKHRKMFTVKLSINGTDFQRRVWDELLKIPYGEVKSYKDVANEIGNPKAVRAVGGANNKNKIPIIIPCHRVIGINGKLVGYAGGIDKKKYLLELENRKG
ncbi:methylated-DNA--[protein]-cysteine S-methyltransferase [Clostridium akagii]|uniref:methylated-DNA--[protein]-cysteine S-methyltransferase n=1 Tax=Clostridium akagii TaxID=91623 RepID=UPI00047C5F9A|nr:methylated-DNA--[protein]-cysteine S-methyltransferase [Clostridium akagii]